MAATLNQLAPGDVGTIRKFTDDATACKLMSMGLLPGTTLRVVRQAPFGGAVYIKADTQQFAIRKSEAACIVLN